MVKAVTVKIPQAMKESTKQLGKQVSVIQKMDLNMNKLYTY
jgi:hypothetical protein